MSINLKYDLSKNIGTAKRIDGTTNYYVGVSKICPSCYTALQYQEKIIKQKYAQNVEH